MNAVSTRPLCPRCRAPLRSEHGDAVCLTHGTIWTPTRAWDAAMSSGFAAEAELQPGRRRRRGANAVGPPVSDAERQAWALDAQGLWRDEPEEVLSEPEWKAPVPCPDCGELRQPGRSMTRHRAEAHAEAAPAPSEVYLCVICRPMREFGSEALRDAHLADHAPLSVRR